MTIFVPFEKKQRGRSENEFLKHHRHDKIYYRKPHLKLMNGKSLLVEKLYEDRTKKTHTHHSKTSYA